MSNFPSNPKPHFGNEKKPMVAREIKKTSEKTISAMASIINANKKILDKLDLKRHECIYR